MENFEKVTHGIMVGIIVIILFVVGFRMIPQTYDYWWATDSITTTSVKCHPEPECLADLEFYGDSYGDGEIQTNSTWNNQNEFGMTETDWAVVQAFIGAGREEPVGLLNQQGELIPRCTPCNYELTPAEDPAHVVVIQKALRAAIDQE